MPIIVVGNKCDEDSKRQVKKELAAKLVGERMQQCALTETSAKQDVNVQQAFQVSANCGRYLLAANVRATSADSSALIKSRVAC